jgi:hypothetical protein
MAAAEPANWGALWIHPCKRANRMTGVGLSPGARSHLLPAVDGRGLAGPTLGCTDSGWIGRQSQQDRPTAPALQGIQGQDAAVESWVVLAASLRPPVLLPQRLSLKDKQVTL